MTYCSYEVHRSWVVDSSNPCYFAEEVRIWNKDWQGTKELACNPKTFTLPPRYTAAVHWKLVKEEHCCQQVLRSDVACDFWFGTCCELYCTAQCCWRYSRCVHIAQSPENAHTLQAALPVILDASRLGDDSWLGDDSMRRRLQAIT